MNNHLPNPIPSARDKRKIPNWLMIGVVWVILAFAPQMMPSPGLLAPQPINKFLNGTLPTTTPSQVLGYEVVEAFPNLIADSTLVFVPEPGTNRIIIGSRQGVYEAFDNRANITTAEKQPFLDINARTAGVWDGGNLGMTFHPDYLTDPTKRFIYIWYCARVEGGTTKPIWGSGENTNLEDDVFLRLSRFSVVDDPGGDYADPATEFIMINVHLYNSSHRGGGMAWDDEGNLLVTIGEQFSAGSAQNITNTLQGGWIRLDVDMRGAPYSHKARRIVQDDPTYDPGTTINGFTGHYAGSEPASQADMANPAFLANPDKEFTGRGYYIPDDNPNWAVIAGLSTGQYFEEYCTIGNRNPHRMTQDKTTGRFWSGEVGAGAREEINVLELDEVDKGVNFGWPGAEGNQGTPSSIGTDYYKPPVTDFSRAESNAIIGGFVYRGSDLPSLVGKYICGGYAQNRIFAVSYNETPQGHVDSTSITREVIASFTPGSLITFGEDHDGEIYLCRQGNDTKIYKLQALGSAPPAPALLSDIDVFEINGTTGDYTGIANLTPRTGVIPYEINVPFWSDGALKSRFLAVPNNEDGDGLHDESDEKMIFSEDGEWQFPMGTVLVKHFDMPVDETDPSMTKRIETRFVVHGDDGKYYYLTYRWREDESDADLVEVGQDRDITIATSSGPRIQVWHYPDQSTECNQCHNSAAGSVLGIKTRQMNRTVDFSAQGGPVGNQLVAYLNEGMFAGAPFSSGDVGGFLTLKETAGSDPLEERARSYLDANCSYCHRPGTGNGAAFDARYSTPLEFQNLIYARVREDFGDPDNRVIVPQDVAHSVAHQRINSTASGIAMPPLAKNEIDDFGATLIADWIGTLDVNFDAPCEGLQVDYYNNIDLTGSPVLTRIEPTVDFSWAAGSPDPSVNPDGFSARFTGEVLPPETALYTFYATADDGVRLWVDNQLLFDGWVLQGPTTYSGTINLTQGTRVPIVLEYFENAGGAVLQLEWAYGSTTQEVIPQTSLCLGEGIMLAQNITFPGIMDKCLGDSDFDLNATASSGLPVTYTITTGDQYINLTNGTVMIDVANITAQSLPLPATVTIEAAQGGDATYAPALAVSQSFQIADGTGMYTLVTNGEASRMLCSDCYIITPDEENVAGTAWSDTKLNLDESFRLELTLNLGDKANPAGGDGMTFALNDNAAGTSFLGTNGSPMAVNGMTRSFGVEFDTYPSTGAYVDIPEDHIAFWANGVITTPLQPPVQASAIATNIADVVDHTVVLEWDPAANLFSVQFDGVLRDVYNGDIRSFFPGGSPSAYYGFGAGTGGATNQHKACIVSLETNISIFNVAIAKTDENCDQDDGEIVLTPSGGTGPYSYQWSAGTISPDGSTASDLSAGVYLVTITDSSVPGNSKTASVNITNVAGPTLSLVSSADANCNVNDGSATVSAAANGGSTAFTYYWSDFPATPELTGTRSDLPTGTYSVTVVDGNGCEAVVASIEIGEIAPITLGTSTTDATFCGGEDGTATVTPDPAGTYDYEWDDAVPGQTTATATNLSAGTYTVTVTDQTTLCEVTATVVVGQTGCPAFDLVGTGAADGGDCYTLTTTAPNNQAGAAWSQTQLDLNNSFIIGAEVFFGNDVNPANTDGADGLAFALHNDPRGNAAIGGYGGSYGIALPNGTQAVAPSFGIEFDTYPNPGEPADDHLSFWAGGDVYTPLQPEVQASSTSTNIEDNAAHSVMITWNVDLQQMSVYFDGVLRDTYTGNLIDDFFGGNNLVYWGFAGGTGGKTNLQQFCITQYEETPAVFTVGISVEDEKCDMADGSVTLAVSGGTAPYTYAWSNGQTAATATGLTADTYSVTITDSAVPANSTVRVATVSNVPGPALGLVSVTDASCSGTDGTATVEATGGTAPYTYDWGNGQTDATATSLAPGDYTVSVSDANNCESTLLVTVGEETPFTLSFSSTAATTCGGADGTATVTASGGILPLTYSWDAAAGGQTTATATGLSFGTYSVTVTDDLGCTNTGSVSVGETGCLGLVTNGDASTNGGDCYTLTPDAGYMAGTAWSPGTIDLGENFTLTTEMYFGDSEAGADGIAFALQADTRATAAIGDIGGSFAIDDQAGGTAVTPSFGVVFKTYPSSADDRVYVFQDGNTTLGAAVVGPSCATGTAPCGNIEDDAAHTVVFEWSFSQQLLTVTFDGVQVIQYDGSAPGADLPTILGTSQVYWGFGAGTGGAINRHEVCITSLEVGGLAFQSIDFPMVGDLCADEGPIQLNATASSGLPVSYTILAGSEFVEFDAGDPTQLNIIKGGGEVIIEATQPGDAIFGPAAPIQQSFMIDEPTRIAFNVNGNAEVDLDPDGCECYILTDDAANEAGTIWSEKTLDLNYPFTFEFDISMSIDNSANNQDNADGITFALQNVDAFAVGANGTAMAVNTLPYSFGLEFDNYAATTAILPANTPYDPGTPALFELQEDHLSFWANGDVTVPLAGPVLVTNPSFPDIQANFEDGQQHRVRITWDPVTQTMSATFDDYGNQVLSYTAIGNGLTENLVDDFLNGNSRVHFGFGAGTGGKTSLQKVCIIELCRDVVLNLDVMLQGPYNDILGEMTNELLTTLDGSNQPLIPLTDPYGLGETVVSLPVDIVDWILVEIRHPDDPTLVVDSRACFVTKTGTVVDLDGSAGVTFSDLCMTEAYISIKHRNHLGVMTATEIPLLFDLTVGTN